MHWDKAFEQEGVRRRLAQLSQVKVNAFLLGCVGHALGKLLSDSALEPRQPFNDLFAVVEQLWAAYPNTLSDEVFLNCQERLDSIAPGDTPPETPGLFDSVVATEIACRLVP